MQRTPFNISASVFRKMSHPPLGFTSLPGCNWSMVPSSNLYNNKITTAHVLPDVYILFPPWVNISWITLVVHQRLVVNCFLPKLSLWRLLTFWLDTHLQSLLDNPCFIRHHNHHYRLVNFSISIECLLEIVRIFPHIYNFFFSVTRTALHILYTHLL
jgi:hypothetical protein